MTKTKLINPKTEELNPYALFIKYMAYWPWFVASILLCLSLTIIYLRYQTPVYNIQATVLIKEQDSPPSRNNQTLATIQEMGIVTMTNNFDNELQIMKSQSIVRKVVADLGLYIDHREIRSWGYDVPMYNDEPVKVYMSPEEADKLEDIVTIDMNYVPQEELEAEVKYMHQGKVKTLEKTFEEFPAVLPTEIGVITFTPQTNPHAREATRMKVLLSSPDGCAEKYADVLSVEPVSKTTTIAQINVHNTVKQRGIDFIYRLVDIYNQDANDEKNEVAQKTAEFIEERITIIDRELGNTENTLADFKQRSRLTNLESDAQMALQETSRYEQQLTENATQRNLIQDLKSYIEHPANKEAVIPANTGINDPNLAHVINQYNTMLIERKRLLRTSSESNPAFINLNSGIEAMRTTVQTTVNSVLRGLDMTEKNLLREARKHESRISNAPTHEKEYISIARQQEIKANLYTMLLQKREENAITLASTASNGRIIETPIAEKTPVSPQKKVYLLGALMLGIALPVGLVFLKDVLQFWIEGREDVERITSVPVLGEIPKGDMQKNVRGAILIHENKNDLMEEAFRNLRTNLLFMLRENEKTIMVTSSQPSEGKSFVSGNLATSLAYLGKKTLIVGMDIRKSGLEKVLGRSGHEHGITDYLANPDATDLLSLIRPSDIHPNLHILVRGSLPPNPTELVARPALKRAIEELKTHYDLIVLDTAPIAMVTDTSIISRMADICLYVCRADHTSKTAFGYINTLQAQAGFCQLGIVLNGIDLKKRKHRLAYQYGYGYGQKYGYRDDSMI